ncbi:MAG: hypothetical protein Q9193_001328 [Seirophora villosa]
MGFAHDRCPYTENYSEQLPHHVLIDLAGRFNVWAGNIGAGQQGRASLDYRLREATHIQETVVQMLMYLNESLRKGVRPPFDEITPESESSESTESSESSESSGFGDDDSEQDYDNAAGTTSFEGLPTTELQQLRQSIASFISNLYKISIVVRQNPTPRDRLVKSAKIDTHFYEEWDQRHLQEKYPRADPALLERLGKANSTRRKYFKYREQHREKLSLPQNEEVPGSKNAPATESVARSQAHNQKSHTIVEGNPSIRQPTIAKESTTASTFVPRSLPLPLNIDTPDQLSDAATQTTTGSQSSAVQDCLSIPSPPKESESAAEFECPYCYTIFSYRTLDPRKRKKDWRQHVLRDLQPYVCTFNGCSQLGTLYERRSDWMRHETQCHRREWSCNAKGHDVYPTRDELKTHMERQHKDSFKADHLEQIVDLLERPANSTRSACPLCCDERYGDLDVYHLERHLGRHLQVVASFTLPRAGPASLASDASVAAQNAKATDEDSSLSKSASRDYAQPSDAYVDSNEVFDLASAKDGHELKQVGDSLQGLPALLNKVVSQKVSMRCARNSLRYWKEILSSRTLHPHLDEKSRRSRVEAIIDTIPTPAENDTFDMEAMISVGTIFRCAGLGNDELGKADSDKWRYLCLGDFTQTLIAHCEKEEYFELAGSLLQLQEQLTVPLPSEIAAYSEEDWSFMRQGLPPSQEGFETSEQGKDDPMERFCENFASADQSSILSRILQGLCPGTGSWLMETKHFQDFKAREHKVLLIYGLRKWLQSSTVECLLKNRQPGVAKRGYEAADSADVLFSALIHQLVRQLNRVPTAVQWLLQDCLVSSPSFSQTQLETMLTEILNFFEYTTIVLDALDKMGKSSALTVSRFIRRLSNRGVGIQLLATSRMTFDVIDAFWDPMFREGSEESGKWSSSVNKLHLNRQAVNDDIARYGKSLLTINPAALLQDVINEVIRHSDGM